jgi:Meiotically up-regulated gene 113
MNDLYIPVRQKSNRYYVYIFHLIGTDFYKIGFTTHLRERWNKLNSSYPFDLACYGYFKFETNELATGFEKYLHSVYKPKNIVNKRTRQPKEWFVFNDKDLMLLPYIHKTFLSSLVFLTEPISEFIVLNDLELSAC